MYTLVKLQTIAEHRHPPHNTIGNSHAKILVSALERQVSWDNIDGEFVNHQCNLALTLQNMVIGAILYVTQNIINGEVEWWQTLRAGLHYGGEVHLSWILGEF